MIRDEWQSGTKGRVLIVVLGTALAILLVVMLVLCIGAKPWLAMSY